MNRKQNQDPSHRESSKRFNLLFLLLIIQNKSRPVKVIMLAKELEKIDHQKQKVKMIKVMIIPMNLKNNHLLKRKSH